jgi:ammonia channel protein AmtB
MGFALGPTLATIFWNPGLTAAVGVSAMRTVVLILAGVQALTLATVLGYRVQRDASQAKPSVESSAA